MSSISPAPPSSRSNSLPSIHRSEENTLQKTHSDSSIQHVRGVSNSAKTLPTTLLDSAKKFPSTLNTFFTSIYNFFGLGKGAESARESDNVTLSSVKKLEPQTVKISDMATVNDSHTVLRAKIDGANTLCVVVKRNESNQLERTITHVHRGDLSNGLGPVHAKAFNDFISRREPNSNIEKQYWVVGKDSEPNKEITAHLSQFVTVEKENSRVKFIDLLDDKFKVLIAKEITVLPDGKVIDENGKFY